MFKYNFLFIFFLFSALFLTLKISAQGKTIYNEFNTFFDKEIKYQGVKGNWVFGLNEITAYHKFDYNNDGFNDMLIEFNAVPVDEGNYTNYYAVLFKNNSNQEYEYVNYIDTVAMTFTEFTENIFVFQKNGSSQIIKFLITNSKFGLVK